LNNRIDHIGKFYWASSGIYIAQSGENRIANNLVHNVPYIGITLSGARNFQQKRPRNGEGYRSIRWPDFSDEEKAILEEREMTDLSYAALHARNNSIEGNEVFAAVEVLGDGNAIYLSGAGTGNRIIRNYVHHILSDGVSTAMRPDDLQKETLFEENIIYKCVYGAVEHKHRNDYINNIFACIYPTNIHGRPWKSWAYILFGRGPNTGTRIQNNIFYGPGGEPRFWHARGNSPMHDSEIDSNLYWCAANPDIAKAQLKALQQAGHDLNSTVADPQFGDMENADFSLPADSPAHTLGIRSIDTTTIGLQSPWKEKLVGTNLLHTQITIIHEIQRAGLPPRQSFQNRGGGSVWRR
jgi:parallel beta-helix repeat protein